MNPIAAALAPFRKDLTDAGERLAVEYMRAIDARIAEHGGNVEEAYPLIYRGEPGFDSEVNQRNWQIWKNCGDNGILSFRRYVYIEKQIALMETAYDAFTERLCERMSTCENADIIGNPITSVGVLVTLDAAGNASRWQIKQINNVSKFGAIFPQWPVRKVR